MFLIWLWFLTRSCEWHVTHKDKISNTNFKHEDNNFCNFGDFIVKKNKFFKFSELSNVSTGYFSFPFQIRHLRPSRTFSCATVKHSWRNLVKDKAFVDNKWVPAQSGSTFEGNFFGVAAFKHQLTRLIFLFVMVYASDAISHCEIKRNDFIELVRNPATNEVLGSVPDMDDKDARVAVESAHKAFHKWKLLTAKVRSWIVFQCNLFSNQNIEHCRVDWLFIIFPFSNLQHTKINPQSSFYSFLLMSRYLILQNVNNKLLTSPRICWSYKYKY